MKETRFINIPKNHEIDKIQNIDNVLIVTFKEKERILPKSWEEFCQLFPIKLGECAIRVDSSVIELEEADRFSISDRNVIPDKDTTEAILTLCQLIQLRNCYNGGWIPDWNIASTKYTIEFQGNIIIKNFCKTFPQILYFKTEELRNEFLENFHPLIEKLKPLYRIKEGGEQ